MGHVCSCVRDCFVLPVNRSLIFSPPVVQHSLIFSIFSRAYYYSRFLTLESPYNSFFPWTAFKWPHRDHPVLRLSNLCLFYILLVYALILKGFEAAIWAICVKNVPLFQLGGTAWLVLLVPLLPPTHTSNLISFQDSNNKRLQSLEYLWICATSGTKISFCCCTK